jgi:hypothetical protein
MVSLRLFVKLDETTAQETVPAYAWHVGKLPEHGTDLPQLGLRAERSKDAESQYPFHPELLRALSLKTPTIPNFRKPSGAQGLLSQALRRLRKPPSQDALHIHAHHLDVDATMTDLTSRLTPAAYRWVMDADGATGTGVRISPCQDIDHRFVEAGKPTYARRAHDRSATPVNIILRCQGRSVPYYEAGQRTPLVDTHSEL